jgi:copper resistance protein B
MKALLFAGLASLALATPAAAQHAGHAGHGAAAPAASSPSPRRAKPVAKRPPPARKVAPRPPAPRSPAPRPAASRAADPHAGHDMPAPRAPVDTHASHKGAPPVARPDPHAGHDMAQTSQAGDSHAGHDMSQMPDASDPHAGHDMSAMPMTGQSKVGTDLPAGDAPAPAPQPGLAAARYWGAETMAKADRDLRREHGGMTYPLVMLNIAEYQARKGRDGYRWDGEASFGGDIDRFLLKIEGEGSFGEPLEQAELQALYNRALDPYWNLQVGIRHDITPNPSRTYATIGIEGLAPYWFEVEGALFVSNEGEVSARAEAYYDQRITQDLVLQPRVEANFSAQDVPELGTGSGLTDLEVGLRLRYERVREFAPYVGVSWERQFGDTARFSRARGDGTGGFSFVAGVRAWF